MALLAINSGGGIGLGPVDDASDRTSEILDVSLGAVNESVQDPSNGEADSTAPSTNDFEREIHSEINDIRDRNGVNGLEYSSSIAGIARNHSQDMNPRSILTTVRQRAGRRNIALTRPVTCSVGSERIPIPSVAVRTRIDSELPNAWSTAG